MNAPELSLRPDTSGPDWPASWQTHAHGVGVGRYVDPAFLALENAQLWRSVWQVAAREDEIPAPGDFTVYEIIDQSVVLVRQPDGSVKGFHNFCPHRGTSLADGPGHFQNGRIICPFHGWRWDLEGSNTLILEPQEFRDGKLQASDVQLRACAVEVFAGFVFVHFDRNPPSFDDYIAPVRELLEDLAIGEMRHYWWKELSLPCNWKAAQEAFMEAYHVSATHPQLDKVGSEIVYGDSREVDGDLTHKLVEYEALPQGHGRFFAGSSPLRGRVQRLSGDPIDAMTERLMLIVDGMDAMTLQADVDVLQTLRGRPIPEGSSLGGEYVRALYETAEAEGRPMPKPKPELMSQWGGEVFLFPNFLILPQAGNCEFYRSRPDPKDPDRCRFEIWSSRTLPAGAQAARAEVFHVTDPSDPQQLLLIPRQDLSNLERVQRGMHNARMRQNWLSARQETLILNMHRELDRYLIA